MRETARFAWVVMALALATVPMPVRWAMTTGFDGMWWPEPPRGSNGFLGTTNMVVNATGEKVGVVFQVPRTGTLNKIEYRTGTVNTPESNRVSFQDVDLATGFPDGTADQFRAITPSANSWNVPGVMTDDGTDTGAKRSVTRGEWLSAVVEFESTVGSQINVCRTASNTVSNIFGPAYQVHDTGSGWAVVSCDPIMALQYSDGTYAFVSSRVWPINGSASTAFSTSSSPDERGNRISIPARFN